MKRFIFAVLLACAAGKALAFDASDVALTTSLVLLDIDRRQTLHIVHSTNGFREENPLIGKRPSAGRINTYFAVSALNMVAMHYVWPKSSYGWLALEVYCVGVNVHNGFGIGASLHF